MSRWASRRSFPAHISDRQHPQCIPAYHPFDLHVLWSFWPHKSPSRPPPFWGCPQRNRDRCIQTKPRRWPACLFAFLLWCFQSFLKDQAFRCYTPSLQHNHRKAPLPDRRPRCRLPCAKRRFRQDSVLPVCIFSSMQFLGIAKVRSILISTSKS